MKRLNTAEYNHDWAGIAWRKTATTLLSLAVMAGFMTTTQSSAEAQNGVRKQADFNGDGFGDLAIGAPGESYWFNLPTGVTNMIGAGCVHITYGGPGGLAYGRKQLLSRASEPSGSLFRPSQNMNFGRTLAWGDFNRDGYDDLAIGSPNADNYQGAVDIYLGSSRGFTSRPNQVIRKKNIPKALPPAMYDGFGWALAAGDMNGDGYAELAISQNYGSNGHGAVYVLPGVATGVNTQAPQTLTYFSIYGPSSMVIGDFNGNGIGDLAMGLPFDYKNGRHDVGKVLVAYGTVYGLDNNVQFWDQDSPGIADFSEAYDHFGYALATADFNRDGKWDLAIGAPGEDSNTGVAHIIFGGPFGLQSLNNQVWSRVTPYVYGEPIPGDRFGESLAAAHLDYDNAPELIVGIPGDNNGAGGIQTLTIFAGPLGIRHSFWNQDSYQILGDTEPGDRFGTSLAVGDWDGNGTTDVAIGVPGENASAGAVNVIYGTQSGLSWPYNQILMQGYMGIPDMEEAGDGFGKF